MPIYIHEKDDELRAAINSVINQTLMPDEILIIADKEILEYYRMDKVVRGYLEKLDREFSFYLPYSKEKKLITNNNLNLIEE